MDGRKANKGLEKTQKNPRFAQLLPDKNFGQTSRKVDHVQRQIDCLTYHALPSLFIVFDADSQADCYLKPPGHWGHTVDG